MQHEKHISHFDLPTLTLDNDHNNATPRVIQEKLLIPIPPADTEVIHKLNDD